MFIIDQNKKDRFICIFILSINFSFNLNQLITYYRLDFSFLNVIIEVNKIVYSSLYFTSVPSPRLKSFLTKHNLNTPIFILEINPINKISLPIKSTLNSIAGTYSCINLVNYKTYVGSASINCMYRRYVGHILKGIGGSMLVKRAVSKYGLDNFAFVVIETTEQVKNKEEILRIEQKYIDLLLPGYNIAKIAGSLLNTKWKLESKLRHSIRMKEHLNKIRLLIKPVSKETRALLK